MSYSFPSTYLCSGCWEYVFVKWTKEWKELEMQLSNLVVSSLHKDRLVVAIQWGEKTLPLRRDEKQSGRWNIKFVTLKNVHRLTITVQISLWPNCLSKSQSIQVSEKLCRWHPHKAHFQEYILLTGMSVTHDNMNYIHTHTHPILCKQADFRAFGRKVYLFFFMATWWSPIIISKVKSVWGEHMFQQCLCFTQY